MHSQRSVLSSLTLLAPLLLNACSDSTGADGDGPPSITVSFAGCTDAERPIWFAAQDGNKAWHVVNGTADSYSFTMGQSKGGFAYVTGTSENGYQVHVNNATRNEFVANAPTPCLPASTRNYTVPLSGITTNQLVLYLGGVSARADEYPFNTSRFVISEIPQNAVELVGWKRSSPRRGFLRRNITQPDGAALAPITATGADWHDMVGGTLTVTNSTGPFTHGIYLATGPNCQKVFLEGGTSSNPTPSPRLGGFPVSALLQHEYHQLQVQEATRKSDGYYTSSRVEESFQGVSDRSVTLGPRVTPTMALGSGGYRRLQATMAIPPEYQTSVNLYYYRGGVSGRSIDINATYAWFGGNTATLTMPDFDGLPGWDNNFSTTATMFYQLTVTGQNYTGTACHAGARRVDAIVTGESGEPI